MSAVLPPPTIQKRLQCQHNRRKDHCPVCNGCQHNRRKDQCRECNGCPHGRRKGACGECGNHTCEVDGCLDKGYRFSTKFSLRHHTSSVCSRRDYTRWDPLWRQIVPRNKTEGEALIGEAYTSARKFMAEVPRTSRATNWALQERQLREQDSDKE